MAQTVDTLPINFNIPNEGAVVSYNYTDLASGEGYQTFYGGTASNGDVLTQSNKFISETTHTSSEETPVSTTSTKYIDKDFDITFNTPRTIKGKLFVSVPIGVQGLVGGESWYFKLITKVYHYDGSTETQLGSTETGKEYFSGALGANGIKGFVATNYHDLTQKGFKVGETIRITVEGWYRTNGGTARNAWVGIGHDPTGRADQDYDSPGGAIESAQVIDSDTNTTLQIDIPFKIET